MTEKTMTEKTIKLIVPDWQAGDNPIYQLGAQVLNVAAPKNKNIETVNIEIADSHQPLVKENNVRAQSAIFKNVSATKDAILDKNPDRIITLGGNCLVSQAPIDYLNGKYDNLGIIWIDAHPDISTPRVFDNEHAMVVGNLLHRGDPKLAGLVDNPLRPEQIYHAGLVDPTPDEEKLLKEANLDYTLIKGNELDLADVQKWIKKNNFTHLYIHLDVDVMNPDPKNFYPTYFNNPDIADIPYNAAVGKASRQSTFDFIYKLSQQNDLVGFTIAEFMPWGVREMQNLMNLTGMFEA